MRILLKITKGIYYQILSTYYLVPSFGKCEDSVWRICIWILSFKGFRQTCLGQDTLSLP